MIRLALIFAFGFVLSLYCPLVRGQSDDELKPGCSTGPAPGNPDSETQIILDSVEFAGQSDVPTEIQEKLLHAVRELHESLNSDSAPNASWLEDVKESVRLAAQNLGHFRVLVDATTGLIRAEPRRVHYWISLDVKLGPKYVLGDMSFSKSSEFPEGVLRKEFALQRGDIFDVSKIREGIQRISRLYGKRGYIDMTAEAEFQIHDDDSEIDLNLKIDQGGQYRIKSVEIRGVDGTLENLLLSRLQPGQVFDSTVMHALNGVPSENARIWRDVRNSTVEVVIGTQSCGDERAPVPEQNQPSRRTRVEPNR